MYLISFELTGTVEPAVGPHGIGVVFTPRVIRP
jgi:hypothetical protein